jgi:hypothetical protein
MLRESAIYKIWTAAIAFICLLAVAPIASAQVNASISGRVIDQSAAAISTAKISAREMNTGAVRSTVSDDSGRYRILELPVGLYEIRASKQGFQDVVQTGIHLVVGQDATIDLALRVGVAEQVVSVTADSPLVSVTTTDISGLVNGEQVKELPLNGRSYDELLTLDAGIVNFTAQKTGGVGISNSTVGNMFAVSGNRPQQNLFLLNGIEYTGAAENNMQPGGTSQQLLGVDAVREFNVEKDTYGAEYGKHPGAQVSIITQSGSNRWHGNVFEFLRNNRLDAPNFFDQGSAPPFQRNQFGGSLGGPIQSDKTFFFVNYEAFIQNLHVTDVTLVPDNTARASTLGPGVAALLNLWPVQSPGAPDNQPPGGGPGISEAFSNPLQTIREHFGTARIDHAFSIRDKASVVYTVDDSNDVSPTLNPFSTDIESLREQVLSFDETHVFSPNLVNTARFGYSRASYFYTGEPTPGTPAASLPGFLVGHPVGAVVVGGSAASNSVSQLSLAGSNNGSKLSIARNLFTFEDRVTFVKGRHQFSFGAWIQPIQSNSTLGLSQFGQATFSSLTTFLAGTMSSFLFEPTPTPLNWHTLEGAWFAEDVIRINPSIVVSLGFRAESTDGWNEAHGRASNFIFGSNGALQTQPQIGNSVFTKNNATFLPQPRIGLAWSPHGRKTVIRTGFGLYNDLQDALGYRTDNNAPFNTALSIANLAVSKLPITPGGALPGSALVVPAGVLPDLKTPTLISYSLKIEHELTPNTVLTVGYVGSHGYHELLSLDANIPVATICPAAPCPAVFPASFPAPMAGTPVPPGTFFIPAGTPKANPALANTFSWYSLGTSNYNALIVDINHRFSNGLAFRGVYTWSKSLDDGDSLNATAAANAPGLVANPANIKADYGLATYDVRNVAAINATYALPFGLDKQYLNGMSDWENRFVSGWSLASIVTIQGGFPFTPQLSYNPSNNGDTRNPVRPFINPSFTGPVITGNTSQWFNPTAFLEPPNNSGFYGNLGRDALIGPGLATWDFSVLKDTRIRESLNLQFRAEIFNLLNRANFNTPNPIVFTPTGVSLSAGVITGTATTSRQVQFGLKLIF